MPPGRAQVRRCNLVAARIHREAAWGSDHQHNNKQHMMRGYIPLSTLLCILAEGRRCAAHCKACMWRYIQHQDSALGCWAGAVAGVLL